MRIALLVDAFAPARTSAAVQMRDLARALASAGHQPTVVVPGPADGPPWSLGREDGVEVLRLRAPNTKDIGRLRRALAESWLPVALAIGLRRSPLAQVRWDGVAWYSPTIFLGPVAGWLKRRSQCRGYLILRDLFPDWAVDAGLLRKGIAYAYFKAMERLQYRVADVIGVQTPANLPLLAQAARATTHVEVLHNWLAKPAPPPPSPRATETTFVYAGNMGAAQQLDNVLALAARLQAIEPARFLFVGRGTDVARLKERTRAMRLERVEFRDEVEPEALPGVLATCDVGLIALDPRHRTHNIPGKLLTYLHAGLPVLAHVNPGNDLAELIKAERVGRACATGSVDDLVAEASALLEERARWADMGVRGRELAARMFSPASAAAQIIRGLSGPATLPRP